MNYSIEILYLLFAFTLMLILCIILTSQLFNIYTVEKSLQIFLLGNNHKIFTESTAYNISQLYAKKCQWIEAIQPLETILLHKKLNDRFNKYTLSNLCHNISCLYQQSSCIIAAKYYSQIAKSFRNQY